MARKEAKEPKVAQIWECPECEAQYKSPLAILSVVCSNRHKSRNMARVWGEECQPGKPRSRPKLQTPTEPKPESKPEPSVSRPRVKQVKNTELLLEAFGIKESNG